MEATGCRLAMTGHSTMVIVSVYPTSPKPLLRSDLRALLALGDAVILFGDFNCKNPRWGCAVMDENGEKLDRLQDRLEFEIVVPSTATYFPHKDTYRTSTLDIALMRQWSKIQRRFGILGDILKLISALPTRSESSSQEFLNKSWSDLTEEIRPSHKAFWKITKALKTKGYTPIPQLKRPDGTTALDDAEVAECIADSIETRCSHVSPPHDLAHINSIEEEVLQKTFLEPKDDLTPVSLSEVQLLVKSLKTRKAPGLDGVSNKAIKCFSQPLLSLLVAIFNACLQNYYFPSVWKEAEVIGIHKPGKPRDLLASYRPISLLSGLAKLFETVLKTRLSNHLFGKGLIIDEQFGFRPAHSCPQQILRLVEYVTEGFKTKQKTVAVFFDVAKTFDRVWNAGLSRSSARLRPSPSCTAYTNDIPRPTSGVQLALFADDTALFFRSRTRRSIFRHLPKAIDELGQWFRKWRIEVNPDKSAAIQFKYSKNKSRLVVDRNTPNLKMLNSRIPWQRSYKYLGVTLDKNLHFREHIARVRKNALFYTARLGAILGRKSKLPRRNKRTLYKMCIRTVMTYASPVFAHADPKVLYRLQVVQNKSCRAATDAHWCVRNSILHRDMELPTLTKYMKDASKRFFDIVGPHPNALLRAAVDYQPPPPTHFLRRHGTY
ncbi:Probable RNA-directed DNA polymerase from transposon BS [Eumeta japonica]|uniref:Probable RNA-directed DNA polymerase from transposon BS n=1 Tax=Eumeta variegata TaxID=151549 RepID=A0A4C1WNZ0_EUMVA|nr:Probable RNA-directed DNA polymerase from transposon BS [Eumeta japonica]